MTKDQAVHRMVELMSAIPQEWVKIVAEHYEEYPCLPMWGTMFIENHFSTDYLLSRTKEMSKENFGDDFDEEMEGERVFVYEDGSPTNIYLYEVDGKSLIGIHGAGYSFYDSTWITLYDILGLKWHDEEETKQTA